MTESVRRLRAQKFYSTDPEYLERMARREEVRTSDLAADVADDTQIAAPLALNPGARSR